MSTTLDDPSSEEAREPRGGSAAVHVAAEPRAAADPRTLLATRRPDPCVTVLFGATGDLASRKLVPALYQLARGGHLPEHFGVIGFSRSARSEDALRQRLRDALGSFSRTQPIDEAVWKRFGGAVHAVAGNIDDPRAFADLRDRLAGVDSQLDTGGNRLYYLATPPSAFPPILKHLHGAGLVDRGPAPTTARAIPKNAEPWSRVVVEKPFGRDLATARELNRLALELMREDQIYRIDHYLGKETVQNILAVRFGNAIFEPLWNRQHIDHVQITMAENIGVEGRGAFYEETGVLRDIVQNHLLQVLALVAMEAPVSFEADEIRNMKAQVLRSLRRIDGAELRGHVVRGQYRGYREEEGVAPDSSTPTFVALKANVDNWRWQGVPFYVRAGKALAGRMTEVAVHFRSIPHCLFGDAEACQLIPSNVLKIRIQPDEGMALEIASKIPGEELRMGSVSLDFRYAEAFDCKPVEAYERLLLDCMRGDPTLFARRDEVELSWRFCTPILEAWEQAGASDLAFYGPGEQGPSAAEDLLRADGRRWERIA